MKKAILLFSLFAVSSCAETPLVPSSTKEASSPPEKKADCSFVNFECGVEPDIPMALTNAYDLEKLDVKLQTLSAA